MTTLHRVMFDTNDGSMSDGYCLGFDQSKRDLSAIGEELKVGLRVVIYMVDELEMEAILERNDQGDWMGRPISGTLKHFASD